MNRFDRREWMKTLALAAGAAGAGNLVLRASEGGGSFAGQFARTWGVKRKYALEVAEAMTAEQYSHKPTEEMRPFAELLAHIGSSTVFFASLAVDKDPGEGPKAPEEPTRDAMIAFLGGACDYAAGIVATMSDEKAAEKITVFGESLTLTRGGLLEFMRDHVTHHLGYAIPYLRTAGLEKVPAYGFIDRNPSPM